MEIPQEANMDRTEGRKKQIHFWSWRLQRASYNNWQIKCAGNQSRHSLLNSTINWLEVELIFSKHSIQHQQNAHFSPTHMEYSPRQITYWAENHLSKFRRKEITQNMLSDHNGIKLEISNSLKRQPESPKYLENKQHASK